jgi:hypothetical protein
MAVSCTFFKVHLELEALSLELNLTFPVIRVSKTKKYIFNYIEDHIKLKKCHKQCLTLCIYVRISL